MVVLCCIVVVTGFLPSPVSRSSLSSPPSQVFFFFWDPRVKPGARRILGPFPTSWIFVFDRFLISFDLFFGILHPKAKGHRGYKGISHSLVRSVVSAVILT